MINAEHPDAPLSKLSDVQLREISAFPILISNFLFELYLEISRRQIVDRKILLGIVLENYKISRARELELELMSLEGRSKDDFRVLNIDIDKVRKSINNNRYHVALNFLANCLLTSDERKGLFPRGEIMTTPKKTEAIELGVKILAVVKESGRTLTQTQKQALIIAEEIAGLQEKKVGLIPGADVVKKDTSQNLNLKMGSSGATSWQDTLRQIRHGRLHPDAKKINHLLSSGDWADASPLKMLGYSVNSKDGLPEKERHELLKDFCELADLPKNLPVAYLRPWGDPNTNTRILRTAKHLGFVRRNFEKQDSVLYARAIECWRKDFEFLEKLYGSRLTRSEWEQARKGM